MFNQLLDRFGEKLAPLRRNFQRDQESRGAERQLQDATAGLTGKDARVAAFRARHKGADVGIGVGGSYAPGRLLEAANRFGINSWRVWGTDMVSPALLAEAKQAGIVIVAGLWIDTIGSTNVQQMVNQAQGLLNMANSDVIGAILIGNEVETRSPADQVFSFYQAAASAIRGLPNIGNRLLGTAVAELGKGECNPALFSSLCPACDVLTVNAFVSAPSVYSRLGGWNGYFMLGEYGTMGQFQSPRSPWGAPIEPSSTAKGSAMISAFLGTVVPASPPPLPARVQGGPKCIGSYLFFHGSKPEGSPWWYSLVARNGPDFVHPRLWTLSRMSAAYRDAANASPNDWNAAKTRIANELGPYRDPNTLGATMETANVPHVMTLQALSADGAVLPASPTVRAGAPFRLRCTFSGGAIAGSVVTYLAYDEGQMTESQFATSDPQPVWQSQATPTGTPAPATFNRPGNYRVLALVRKEGQNGIATAALALQVQ